MTHDEAEIREVLAKAYEREWPDDKQTILRYRTAGTDPLVPIRMVLSAMRTIRAQARREALEEFGKASEACKGEQYKFEEWAKAERYDMQEHPLHYLFLDPKTYEARQGWKAALAYIRRSLSPKADERCQCGCWDLRFGQCPTCPTPSAPDRPVKDWRDVPLTAGMLWDALAETWRVISPGETYEALATMQARIKRAALERAAGGKL